MSEVYFKKSTSFPIVTVTRNGVSLRSEAVNKILDNYGKPESILIGYDRENNNLLIKPEQNQGEGFECGERMERDSYFPVQSKSLVRWLSRKIIDYEEKMSAGENDFITVECHWYEENNRLKGEVK